MTNLDLEDLDPMDINTIVLQLVKKCTTFIPHGINEIRKKLTDMNLLCYMWSADTDEDYSADVYAAAVEMLAVNAFRPLPPSAYAGDDDVDEDATTAAPQPLPPPPPSDRDGGPTTAAGQEWSAADDMAARTAAAQTTVAHAAFQAFVERERFDAATAAAHLDRRFAGRLAQRLNSADDDERLLACETMGRLWRACPPARGRLLDAAVAELAELAYGFAPRHNGVRELLTFCADAVADDGRRPAVRPAGLDKLFKVFIQLLKHPSLLTFKYKLVECVKVFNYSHPDIVFRILEAIEKLWSCHCRKTIVLLRTMVELYEWCGRDKWISLQIRVVGHLSKFFYNEDFQLAEEAMNFWNRILHDNTTFWQRQQDNIAIVVNALKKVKETHWNPDCVKMAECMLNIMVSKNVMKVNYEEDLETNFRDNDSDKSTLRGYNHTIDTICVQLSNVVIDKPIETKSTI